MALPLENAPRDWLLDDNDDVVITTDLQWTTGIDAVAQSCRIALQMFEGEWFLNLDVGIPYWDGILGAKPGPAIALARAEFIDELFSVEGVIDVTKMIVDYDRSTRRMNVTWQVLTALGETPVDTLDRSIP